MKLSSKLNNNSNVFLVIFFLGLILRVLAANQHDFWFDEAYTYFSSSPPLPDLIQIALADNNPPIYYLLIHFILKLGSSELVLRAPSVIAGLATIFMTYVLAKAFLKKRGLALVSAALVASSPLAIYLSTEARPHSLAILLVTVALYSFYRLAQKPQIPNITLFILIMAIGFYTHYYLTLLLIPFTYLVAKKPTRLSPKGWLAIISAIFLIIAPWIILSAKTPHNNCWCPHTFVSLPASLVSPALSGVGIVTLRYFPQLPPLVLAFFSISAILTLVLFFRGIIKNFTFAAFYVLPLLTLSVLGLLFQVFSPKAFAVFTPIFAVLVALGTDSKKWLVSALFFLFTATSIIQIVHPFCGGERLKDVYNQVSTASYPIVHTSSITFYPLKYYARDKQQNILLVKNPLKAQTVKLIDKLPRPERPRYYSKSLHERAEYSQSSEVCIRFRIHPSSQTRRCSASEYKEQQDIDPKSDRLWLVDTTKLTDIKDRQEAISQLLAEYAPVKTFQFDNISVSLLESKK